MKKILAILIIGAVAMLTACSNGGGGGTPTTPTDTAKAQTKTGGTIDAATVTFKGNFTDSEWSTIWTKVQTDLNTAFAANIAPDRAPIREAIDGSTITIDSSGSYTFKTTANAKELFYVKGKSINAEQLKNAASQMGTAGTIP